MNTDDFISQLYKQLGNGGAPYWNWCTDNLWPNQGYFINGYSTPYCAEFVSAMQLWNDIDCYYFPNSFAFDGRDIPTSERYYGDEIKAGDIISFDWDEDAGGDHVGFVTEVCSWGCRTIEGNTGPDLLVMERDRDWSSILFGIRPHYSDGEYIPHNNTSGGKLDIDGHGGYNTVLDMQTALGSYQDGVISGQNRVDQKYFWGFDSVSFDGVGSRVVEKMQQYLGAHVDGHWGCQTSTLLQIQLIQIGYDCGDSGVDGFFGRDSVKALQRALNDGAIFKG